MIGVISKPEQTAVVEEFFQLFKTPWEFHQPGRAYDVVIATVDTPPAVEASLVVFSSPAAMQVDGAWGFQTGGAKDGVLLDVQHTRLPLYTRTCSLKAGSAEELFKSGSDAVVVRTRRGRVTVVRLGYDLFAEVEHLLRVGQPAENSACPALDVHVDLLQSWMVDAGVSFVEIPPVPAGKDFIVSVTHDIDFIGIRRHFFDHTMLGYLMRSTVGALKDVVRGKIPLSRLFRIWWALVKLPFVYLGLAKDFWLPFPWLMEVEKDLPATYYFIPFKGRAGDKLNRKDGLRRACAYDITDIPEWTKALSDSGCEIGVHGIDSWHDVAKGRDEIARVTAVTGSRKPGIRMHWLMWSDDSYRVLEEAGYSYDTTSGYNEAVGYRNGTAQVFRPLGRRELLEMPLHIQDGALFYPGRMDLNEAKAADLCDAIIHRAEKSGGVVTLLWHDRSHGPERFWGEFYAQLIGRLRGLNVWFASGQMTTDWFRIRRSVTFRKGADGSGEITANPPASTSLPALTVRVHQRDNSGRVQFRDQVWAGKTPLDISNLFSGQSAGKFTAEAASA